MDGVSVVETVLGAIPQPYRSVAIRHRELVKFAIVGGTTWVIDTAVFLTLKSSVLDTKPLTAKILAVLVATIVSYVLNREWSFRTRGGRERHHEALLFFAFSGVGVLLSMAPLWFSSYVLQLREPTVSLAVENVADFISAYIIGNLLQMAFRFWAFRRWVFPDQFARDPEKALESALTAGGIAEIFEDEIEGGNVTLLRSWRNRAGRLGQPGDSSEPRVSKTS
jgi:putative flippase GtrA